jgi:hypothetical protein
VTDFIILHSGFALSDEPRAVDRRVFVGELALAKRFKHRGRALAAVNRLRELHDLDAEVVSADDPRLRGPA